MDIKEAQYNKHLGITNIKATIDGVVMFIPISDDNRHYVEITRQVADKKLTIKEAD